MMSSSRKIDQLSEASSNHKLLNISVPKKLGKTALDFLFTVFIELMKHLKIYIKEVSYVFSKFFSATGKRKLNIYLYYQSIALSQ